MPGNMCNTGVAPVAPLAAQPGSLRGVGEEWGRDAVARATPQVSSMWHIAAEIVTDRFK